MSKRKPNIDTTKIQACVITKLKANCDEQNDKVTCKGSPYWAFDECIQENRKVYNWEHQGIMILMQAYEFIRKEYDKRNAREFCEYVEKLAERLPKELDEKNT